MKQRQVKLFAAVVLVVTWSGMINRSLIADEATVEAVAVMEESFAKAFNEGNPEVLVKLFLPEGELIDELGTVYKGQSDLQELFAKYFAKFPGAKLELEIESIRNIGENLAIEEGTRYVSTADGTGAQVRYIAVLSKVDGKWFLASIREVYDEPDPTPDLRLESLAWLVGRWVSEEPDLAVAIEYRWDEGQNFIIGDFSATREGDVIMKSTQRIGWDPLAGKVRSWLFDADGGYAEGTWTETEEGWVIKSLATMPDGMTGSATVTFIPLGDERFQMVGTDRIVGDGRADDFDVTVTRAPPSPSIKPISSSTVEPITNSLRPIESEAKPAAAGAPAPDNR